MLRSPTQLVRAIAYVLGNHEHHFGGSGGVDPYSSLATDRAHVVAEPQTWPVRAGWRRSSVKSPATADPEYGLLGVLGAGCMLSRAMDASPVFRLLGAALIVWLGTKALRTPVPVLASRAATLSTARAFSSSLLLTLANPLTILSFAAFAPGSGSNRPPPHRQPLRR